MKIAFVCQVFSENMGYITNCLPKSLVKLGHEVHVIAPNLQAYFSDPDYKTTYEKFLGPNLTDIGIKEIDGYKLYRLEHTLYKTEPYYKNGLHKTLKEINPDIVQLFHVESIICWQVLKSKIRLGFKMYGANHVLMSVFPLAKNWSKLPFHKRFGWNVKHKLGGKIISLFSEKFYYATKDAEEIGTKWYGASKKKSVLEPFGVDTEIFYPDQDKKVSLKKAEGFEPTDIICIYTGRFSEGKSPLILAKAIDHLASKHPEIKGLFIGNGTQEEIMRSMKNCYVRGFVKMTELPRYYQLADIGVWPRQESISMLDAMASGLPLIINHTVKVTERIEGNGKLYQENDYIDLSNKILEVLSSKLDYANMSKFGVDKILNHYSWDKIARQREKEYLSALS